MANLNSIISAAVSAAAGNVNIPANLKNTVLNGLSESVLGSLTQTATKAGGLEQVKALLTGKTAAATSPVTKLAGSLFTGNVLKNLNLDSATNSVLSGLVPVAMGKLGGMFKDQDGDGDVDLQDILIALSGSKGSGSGLGAAIAGKVLGSIFKK